MKLTSVEKSSRAVSTSRERHPHNIGVTELTITPLEGSHPSKEHDLNIYGPGSSIPEREKSLSTDENRLLPFRCR
jgi:hypothetical protein